MAVRHLLPRLIAALRARRNRLRGRWHEAQARRLLRRRPELAADPAPQSLALLAQFRGLSVNRANLLRLQHDRVMRPQELQALLLAWLTSGEPCPALASLLDETWLDAPSLLEAPVPYAAVETCDLGEAQLHWYRRLPGATSADGDGRRLVLAFTSNANALAMIAPCFLQQLGSFGVDVVLVLRDRPHHRSWYGPDGGSSLLARLLQALPQLVPLADYDHLLTIGYSGGGFAALVAAMALGADRAISLGGWPPQGAVPLDGVWLAALRAALPPARPVQPRLLLCCAAGCAGDGAGTRLAASIVRGWRLPASAVETRAYRGCRDHNLLVELPRRGFDLPSVLADLLGSEDRQRYRRPLFRRAARWRALEPVSVG